MEDNGFQMESNVDPLPGLEEDSDLTEGDVSWLLDLVTMLFIRLQMSSCLLKPDRFGADD